MFECFGVENCSIIRAGQKVGFEPAPKKHASKYSMMKAEIAL